MVKKVQELDISVFAAISDSCGFTDGTGWSLHHAVVTALRVQRCVLHRHMFAFFMEAPFPLIRDPVSHLPGILATPLDEVRCDGVTEKVICLSRLGFSDEQLVMALRLCQQSLTTIGNVEAAHSSQSNVLLFHDRIGHASLQSRGFVRSVPVADQHLSARDQNIEA